MNKASKTIVSVLALVAFIAVGLVFYNERIVNKEKSILDTEGNPIEWIKYENKELGFSFEYPKGFILENIGKYYNHAELRHETLDPIGLRLSSDESILPDFYLVLELYKNQKNESLDEWTRRVSSITQAFSDVAIIKNFELSKNRALWTEINDEPTGIANIHIFSEFPNKKYLFKIDVSIRPSPIGISQAKSRDILKNLLDSLIIN